MKYDKFLKTVQEQSGLSQRDQAANAADATLETLAEHLAGEEPRHLAAQLPPELQEPLRRHHGSAMSLSLQEFCRRIEERAGVPDGLRAAQGVFAALSEAVTPGELDDVKSQLPSDYNKLFDATLQ